jgi:hypothetical protein
MSMTVSHVFPACLLLAITSLVSATPAGDSPSKPNIIFVVADDMGFASGGYADKVQTKRQDLDRWMESVKASFAGKDYHPITP